jgi:hypothetical protein
MQSQHTPTAIVNTVTLSGTQRRSSERTVTTVTRSDTGYNDHCTSIQQDAEKHTGKTEVPERITQYMDDDSQVRQSTGVSIGGGS